MSAAQEFSRPGPDPTRKALSIEKLSFQYPAYPGLSLPGLFNGLNLTIDSGEIAVFLAKPESGKTTLSRIATGLVPKHTGGNLKGAIAVQGVNVLEHRSCQLMELIGVVFQNAEEQLIMTRCDSEVAFALESLGIERQEIARRLREVFELLDLTGFDERNPVTLSGGEKKKLLLACLCAVDPELYILDETFEELDPPSRIKILEYLRAGRKSVLILASRYLKIYSRYADTLYLMDARGVVKNEGSEPQKNFLASAQKEGLLFGPAFSQLAHCKARVPVTEKNRSTIYECQKISFRYREVSGPSLSDFSLFIPEVTLREREIVSIVGKNGSGKSTLCRILAGLLIAESGSIRINAGGLLKKASPSELNMFTAYVFQNPDLQIFLPTVKEELSYGLRLKGINQKEIDRRVGEAIRLFKLPQSNVPPTIMSYGTRKRLQSAVYYLLERELVILDEADSGLSAGDFSDILSCFLKYDCSIVLVTHDTRLAAEVSERILIMERGRLAVELERQDFGKLNTYLNSSDGDILSGEDEI